MSVNPGKTVLVIGECMVELVVQNNQSFGKGYAGDTYNSAVYAKRHDPGLDVRFVTVVGKDILSDDMLIQWQKEGLNLCHVTRSNTALPGIYMVDTQEDGERQFLYWRKHSAATEIVNKLLQPEQNHILQQADLIYLSGISLAILSDADKELLIQALSNARNEHTRIAFDPNYRAALWRDKYHAAKWIGDLYDICDIALPGEDDHKALFNHLSHHEIQAFLSKKGVSEQVIKCGAEGVYGYSEQELLYQHPFKAAKNQVDTTAAGDSFAGTYLAARLASTGIDEAISQAAAVAAQVVQHRGAILSAEKYEQFFPTQPRLFMDPSVSDSSSIESCRT